MTTRVALKIDVCNHRALHQGVPGMLEILGEAGVTASFFVAFGPDNSGKAVRRVFRKGFLKKMVKTRAPMMYGLRTLFYGTLLPAPAVGESAPDLLRRVADEGHEVGLHGFDHVGWHDGVARMDESAVRDACQSAATRFERTLGRPPRFSGAPGWQVSETSLRVQDELGLDFASDCREGEPFYPEIDGKPATTLQLPTTLPTSDELMGSGMVGAADLAGWYRKHLRPSGVNVVGLHAESEGIHLSGWFREWLAEPCAGEVAFLPLSQLAEEARAVAGSRPVVSLTIPGRAGRVAAPGSGSATEAAR